MDNIYQNIEEYYPIKKQNILIVFNDMIADIHSNKNLNSIITKLFIRVRKRKISLVFAYNLILLYQKVLGWILHKILLWKSQN